MYARSAAVLFNKHKLGYTGMYNVSAALAKNATTQSGRSPPMLKHSGVEYKNVLLDIKAKNDLLYCCAKKTFPTYKHCTSRTPAEMKAEILACEPVRSAIDDMVTKKIWSQAVAERQAKEIVDNMAHLFDMKALRSLAYPTKKVLQSVYSGIYVNELAIGQIRALCVENPVIFVPSHRSYMDFVLMQMLCFHYELPVPAIATAQDFLRMKLLAEWMRRCGAFFIRRSFADDPFYRTIFNSNLAIDYVKMQIINGDRTMEAFVEGARSRTGKSLHPKYGFLSTVVEPFLTNRVFDLCLVPVNISYEKVVEETLYGCEALGSEKPPETASALFKARAILGTDYGNAYVTFGRPISVRQFFDQQPSAAWRIDRSVHAVPSAVFEPRPDELRAIKALAHRIVKVQEFGAVLGVWPLTCLVIGRLAAYGAIPTNEENFNANSSHVISDVAHLVDLSRRVGRPVLTTPNCDLTSAVIDQSKLHENFLQYDPSQLQFTLVPCKSASTATNQLLSSLSGRSMGFLVSHVVLSHYSNHCAHVFAPLGYLAASFGAKTSSNEISVELDVLRKNFYFLQNLLAREFVVDQLTDSQNFEMVLKTGVDAEIFVVKGDVVTIGSTRDLQALKFVLEPFMIVYFVCVDFLTTTKDRHLTERDFVAEIQCGIAQRLNDREEGSSAPRWYRTLSTDAPKNCLQSLVDLGAVRKVTAQSPRQNPYFNVSENFRLTEIKARLAPLMKNFYDTAQESELLDEKTVKFEEIDPKDDDVIEKVQIRSKL